MSTDFTFRTGDIECTVVRYGESAGPPASLFPDAPAGERDEACSRYLIDGTNLGLVYSNLLLRRVEQVVVVDAGPGGSHDVLGDALGATGAVVVASHIPTPGRIVPDPESGHTFAPLEPHNHG